MGSSSHCWPKCDCDDILIVLLVVVLAAVIVFGIEEL